MQKRIADREHEQTNNRHMYQVYVIFIYIFTLKFFFICNCVLIGAQFRCHEEVKSSDIEIFTFCSFIDPVILFQPLGEVSKNAPAKTGKIRQISAIVGV